MTNRWKGNFVVATAATSSGTAYTGRANGAWGLNSQLQQKQGGIWAKGQVIAAAPTSLSALGLAASAKVSFTPPSDNGGSSVTYTAISSPGGVTATGSASPITVTGLTNGTTYTFTVTSTNVSGTSQSSSPSNSVTPTAAPSYIGQPYGGGYYAGKIAVNGGGIATHYLIVSPKATGELAADWGPLEVTTGITSVIDGPTNSAALSALGTSYEAARFCENLVIGGYSDWYLPAKNELEVLYYFLKPTTDNNHTASGANPNAVSPEPINTNYTVSSPAITTAGADFISGGINALPDSNVWTSTEVNSDFAVKQFGYTLNQGASMKDGPLNVRAIRRIAV